MMENLRKQLEDSIKETLEFFRPKDAFSWQTLFLLGLFSWGMAILSVEGFEIGASMSLPAATWVLFTMGWIFITTAIGWGMVNQKVKVPLLNLELKPAIWITSALTSAFAFQIWNPSTRAIAIVSWPIVFALFSAFPRFIVVSENKFAVPGPAGRQDILLTTLICLVISAWLQVHFVVQDWINNKYPALRAGDFSNSTFVVQMGTPPPVLDMAERTVRNNLRPLPIPEVRGWLVRVAEQIPDLNKQFRQSLTDESIEDQWLLNVAPVTIYDPVFRLQVFPIVSALEAENEAPLRGAEEQEEEEKQGPVTPEERLTPRSARIGLERRCQILAGDELLDNPDAGTGADSEDGNANSDTDSNTDSNTGSGANSDAAPDTDSSQSAGRSIRTGADLGSEGEPSATEPRTIRAPGPTPPPTRDTRVVCDPTTTLISRRGS